MIDTIEKLNNVTFEKLSIFNIEGIHTDVRIANDILPDGVFKYELQESDIHPFEIITIGNRIHVNFEGTILTKVPIELDIDGYRDVDEQNDIEYFTLSGIKFQDFLQKREEAN